MIYLALGTNLGDRLANLRRARSALCRVATTKIVSAPVYETGPLDCPPDSPPFLNTVLALESKLSPHELLQATQAIETELGREALDSRATNSPRPIDIDLLLHYENIVNESTLTVPHPRLHERLFVLYPFRDLAPSLVPPTHANPIAILLEICESHELAPQFLRKDW